MQIKALKRLSPFRCIIYCLRHNVCLPRYVCRHSHYFSSRTHIFTSSLASSYAFYCCNCCCCCLKPNSNICSMIYINFNYKSDTKRITLSQCVKSHDNHHFISASNNKKIVFCLNNIFSLHLLYILRP